MFYGNITELPPTIQETLPKDAQETYMQAYNLAWEQAHPQGTQALSRESVAHQVAWDVVNREFVHDVKKGLWYRKGEEPLEDEVKKGWFEKLKHRLYSKAS